MFNHHDVKFVMSDDLKKVDVKKRFDANFSFENFNLFSSFDLHYTPLRSFSCINSSYYRRGLTIKSLNPYIPAKKKNKNTWRLIAGA